MLERYPELDGNYIRDYCSYFVSMYRKYNNKNESDASTVRKFLLELSQKYNANIILRDKDIKEDNIVFLAFIIYLDIVCQHGANLQISFCHVCAIMISYFRNIYPDYAQSLEQYYRNANCTEEIL